MSILIRELMLNEIAPCVVTEEISEPEVIEFANTVIDRFYNPQLDHKWSSITLNYTGKMKMRNVPLIKRYYELYKNVFVDSTLNANKILEFVNRLYDKTIK